MTDDTSLDDYCPVCLDFFQEHDPEACERENECAQAELELNEAIGILEGASGWLARGQPLHMADWDEDTREANHILLAAWAQVSREYLRLG